MYKNDWIHVALLKWKHYITDAKVVVVGSTEPTAECIAQAHGARDVTTVEYNLLTYGNVSVSKIETISVAQFNSFYNSSKESFDLAISLSSIEHDGLGRYGDPIDPYGDMNAMRRIMSILRPGGLLMISVPIGPDVVVFNLHRRYGALRLPMLLEGWEILDKLPWDDTKLNSPANWRQTYEPIIVLRKQNTKLAEEATIGKNIEKICESAPII